MQFPLKPFLDRVIVEVIPIEDYYEKSSTIEIELDRTFSQRSDRGIVKAVGDSSEIVEVGDVVQFDPDTAYAGLLYLNPADKNKPEKPKYLQIRIGDLLGKVMIDTPPVYAHLMRDGSTVYSNSASRPEHVSREI